LDTLTGLLNRINELEDKYQKWAAPINAAIQASFKKTNAADYSMLDYDQDVHSIRRAQLEKYDPYKEMYVLFGELCAFYLQAEAGTQGVLRAAAAEKPGILHGLLGFVYQCADAILAGGGGGVLKLGLAAAAIENSARDARDSMLALAELYLAAEEQDLEPEKAFRETAQFASGEKPAGGSASMAGMLSDFPTYAVLRERRKIWARRKMLSEDHK
jgi:hypothetical protein